MKKLCLPLLTKASCFTRMVIIYLNKLKSNLRYYYLLSLFKIISKISNSKDPLGISISKNQEGGFNTSKIIHDADDIISNAYYYEAKFW